jgi:NTE family protein
VIIDGGTLSNFPVWLFDVAGNGQPLRRPTFGFTLTGGKGVGGGVNKVVSRMPWALRFGVDIFHTSQEAWDARFVSHSTRVRTVTVDAGTVGTTDFNLPVSAQDMLIENGRSAAKRFLDRFDLADYENTYHRTFDVADAAPVVAAPEPVLVGGAT